MHHFEADDPVSREFARLASDTLEPSLGFRSALLALFAKATSARLATMAKTDPSSQEGGVRARFLKLVDQASVAELERLTLSELACRVGCSQRHFNRLFQEHFGGSFRSCRTELRLCAARQLLLRPDTKIIQVAVESGFRHIGLFNTMFKRRFGMTPSQWRALHESEPDGRTGF